MLHWYERTPRGVNTPFLGLNDFVGYEHIVPDDV